MVKFLLSVAAAVGLSFASVPSYADVAYTYTGYDFSTVSGPYTTSDSVAGSITFSSALSSSLSSSSVLASATAFSFSDGVNTISSLSPNASFSYLLVSTNAVGDIVDWEFLLFTGTSNDFVKITTTNTTSYGGFVSDYANVAVGGKLVGGGSNFGKPGVWVTAVPEPETYAMMLAGLGLLGFMARRRKQRQAAT